MKHTLLSLLAFFLITACQSNNSPINEEGAYIARNGEVITHINHDFETSFYNCMNFMDTTLQAKITSSSKTRAIIVGELGDGYKISIKFDKALQGVTGIIVKATRYGVPKDQLASQVMNDLMPQLQ